MMLSTSVRLVGKAARCNHKWLVTKTCWQSSAAAAATVLDPVVEEPRGSPPMLVKVPSLPIVGSLWSAYSNAPPLRDVSQSFHVWPELRRRYGDFYSIGLPGLGEGWNGTMYVIQDPKEFMKLLRREGVYPTSIVQKQWAMNQFFKDANWGRVQAIMSVGPEWKRIRSFLQSDLLSPQSAARYIPGIIKAAEHASKGAVSRQHDFKQYLNDCSFDMFSMILLGDLPRIADPLSESKPEDITFCRAVAKALGLNSKINRDIKSLLLLKAGIKSSMYKDFSSTWTNALDLAGTKIDEVLAKREAGTLSKEETDSYLNQAMDRQIAEAHSSKDPVTVEEVKLIAKALLSASVDTTSGMMGWHLVHIAQNPEVQDRIRSELMATTDANGKLTPESISLDSVPYLHATIRESHRLTSPAVLSAIRIMPSGIEVHGEVLPENSTIAFDGYSKGRDPELLEEVDEFRPDRWLPQAIEARKGTPAEVLDHPLFAGPFSQGARRCPGSRVSRNEVNILLSQLILDWEFSTKVSSWKDIEPVLDTVVAPKLPKIDFIARR
jgi:cytochrome P450